MIVDAMMVQHRRWRRTVRARQKREREFDGRAAGVRTRDAVSTRLVLFATGASGTWGAPGGRATRRTRLASPLQLPTQASCQCFLLCDMTSSIAIARAEEPLPTCTPYLMPFHIDYTGPAPISTYFRVKPAPPPGYLGRADSQDSAASETVPVLKDSSESQTSTTSDATLVASSSSVTLDSQGEGSSQVSCSSGLLRSSYEGLCCVCYVCARSA